jgi:SH3-like domain-containing protein
VSASKVGGVCEHPYFASTKFPKVNSHKGPGNQFKVAFAYISPGVPVLITAKFGHWRRIVDPYGEESWIHKSKLSPKRSLIVSDQKGTLLRDGNDAGARVIACLKKNVVMTLLAIDGNWCKVEVRNGSDGKKYVGWVEKGKVFGAVDAETL